MFSEIYIADLFKGRSFVATCKTKIPGLNSLWVGTSNRMVSTAINDKFDEW